MTTESSTAQKQMLETMELIRAFEERVIELYHRGDIAGLVHVGIGQEAVAVAVATALEEQDYLYGTHRSHGHFLARGADPGRLMAEIAGRSDGYCEGRGGSMHIVVADRKLMTATGIVGGTIPLALGTAFVSQEQNQVVAVYFGDGAANTGGFHESLNIASLWNLPVVLMCENNGYAEFTPMSEHTVVERLSIHGQPYGIPSEVVDGNNVLEVLSATRRAVERARQGNGPTIVECLTYRLRGHYVGDPANYRAAQEVEEWRQKDPIGNLRASLIQQGALTEAEADAIQQQAQDRVEQAAQFALASPVLGADAVAEQVFG
jgi:pyruvate dehydrogenase E1 component alpha subunit